MDFAHHWQLRPHVQFLNHGSFGATPTVVLKKQWQIIEELEEEPIQFLAPERELEPKLDDVRKRLAELVQADASDLAFVRNATDGVNAVFRSLAFGRGDEIVVTNHGYNACINAARFAAERSGAVVRVVPIPFPIQSPQQVIDGVIREFSPRTRIVLIDHITSPTGLIFPVAEIIRSAHDRGIQVMVDGAHAPGMIPLNLRELDADYYTANHHKWLCGPKVSGFLYVRSALQDEIRPTVISHAANRPRPLRSRFLAEFDWTGTYDPSPILALPTAIDFLTDLMPGGLEGLMTRNRQLALAARDLLCEALQQPVPAPDEMIGSLVTIPVDTQKSEQEIAEVLFRQHQFEFPVLRTPGDQRVAIRIAMQAYNRLEQVEWLTQLLPTVL